MSDWPWIRLAILCVAVLGVAACLAPTTAQDAPPRPLAAAGSIQDALLRPVDLPFGRPTPLKEVADHLRRTLGIRVAIDRAALGRIGIDPDAAIELELDGARLKTGLKLLLDQVGMTYSVVPEDNLLVLTDREGSDEPLDRLASELKVVHQELHDLQDAVDEIRDALGTNQGGAVLENPTLREENPKPPAEPPADPPARTRPGI